MPDISPFSEKLETGDTVPNDQTVTIRVAKAMKKVRGELKSVCQGGCGAYLTEEEKESHKCPGPPRRKPPRRRKKQFKVRRRTKRETKGLLLNQTLKNIFSEISNKS